MIFFLRYILTFLLIPVSCAFVSAFFKITFFCAEYSAYLCAGFAVAGVYLLIKQRIGRIYIFLHEFNHLLWSVLSGVKVKKFSISRTGGEIEVEKRNVIAALAPYFFPIPLAAFTIIHVFAGKIYAPEKYFFAAQYIIAGFIFGWHAITTTAVITKGQIEIRQIGLFYSMFVIVTLLFFFCGLCFAVISPKFYLADFFQLSYKETIRIYCAIYNSIFKLIP